MLNSLQRYSFNLLVQNSDDGINNKMPQKLYADVLRLVLGHHHGILGIIARVDEEIKKSKDRQEKSLSDEKYLDSLLILRKKLQQQKEDFSKVDYLIGFRKICFHLFFDVLKNDDSAPLTLKVAMQAYIFSGKETDLRKLVNEVQYLRTKGFSGVQTIDISIKQHVAQYQSTYDSFRDFVSTECKNLGHYNEKIKKHSQDILCDADKIRLKRPDELVDELLLVDVLSQTKKVLEHPKIDSQREACLQLARKVSGHSVHWMRITGGILMILGLLAVIVGIPLSATVLGGAAVLVGGAAALAIGWGLFSRGAKKGLSLDTRNAVYEAHRQVIENEFKATLTEILSRECNTSEEMQNIGPLYSWSIAPSYGF